jgi:hypothetical protein
LHDTVILIAATVSAQSYTHKCGVEANVEWRMLVDSCKINIIYQSTKYSSHSL